MADAPGSPTPDDVAAWGRWKLLAASASAVLVLLVGAVAFITNRLLDDSGGAAATSRQMLAGVRQMQAVVRDAEAGVRGYILTGDARQLAPFGSAGDSLEVFFARSRPLVARNVEQRIRLDSLDSLARARLAELRQVVDVRRAENLAAASDVVRAQERSGLSGEVNRLAAELAATEAASLSVRQQVLRERVRTTAILIIVATLTAFVLAATANWVLYRAVSGLARAAEAHRVLGTDQAMAAAENARLYDQARMAGAVADAARVAAEQARRDAEAARQAAERANAAKTDFLSTMSHEIRTPLNAIIGYAELLALGIGGATTPEQQGHIARIRASGHHLLGILTEVLDLAKLESGTFRVAREEGCGIDVADTALSLIRPQAAAKEVSLSDSCTGARDAAYVGDPQRVRQIIVNLLSNAVKFTAPGGRVTVRCAIRNDPPPATATGAHGLWTTFAVEDTGVGIPADELGTIFEPFTQVETGLTRTKGGTGLGLAISRRLARLMGGDVTAESEPGRGSRFTLWLPASPVSQPECAPITADVEDAAHYARREPDLAFTAVGQAILDNADEIVRRHIARIRADSSLSRVDGMSDIQLADHESTFLADIAQSLLILDATTEPAELMRDGSEIQRVISERHGAQRHRLGWKEEELRIEFRVLREAIASTVRERTALSSADTDRGLSMVMRFLDQAERVSLQGFRHAATVDA